MSTATECTVYNLFSVLCHEPCHESSQFKFQRLWYPIVSYLTILAAYQKGGHANGELDWRLWWCWQRNLICPPATLVSQIASFVMSVRLLTVYRLPLFKCNSAARSWTMLNSVNVSTQYSSHDQRFHSWDAKGSHIAKNEPTLNENFRVSPTCEQ